MTLIVICGPTASGKSDLALDVAERIGAEIINADSMQLYRGMDIGTAKLPMEERRGIPHHLLDVLEVDQEANVAWFQEQARAIIESGSIQNNKKNFVIVGGTGLYIKAILDDLNFPDTDPEVRNRLNAEAEEVGGAVLYERLEKLDPIAAIAIPRENIRRIIRALEVIEITGQPYTAQLPRENSTRYPHARQFGLSVERESLHRRIERRVDLMWERGFVGEVMGLSAIRQGKTAQRALGYAQILRFLDGDITEEQAKEETKIATRQYARRQETWFKRDERITWLPESVNRSAEILSAIG